MDRRQVTDVLEKIQVYRQSFLVTSALIEEWCRRLAPYDFEDVDKKLDEYFANGDNFGKYPDLYYLIRGLKTSEVKLNPQTLYTRCQLCNSIVEYEQYKKHYHKCNSIEYLCSNSERYFNRKLDRKKIMALSDSEFDKKYWEFCEKLFTVISEGLEKKSLENALLAHKGLQPTFELNDISKELMGK